VGCTQSQLWCIAGVHLHTLLLLLVKDIGCSPMYNRTCCWCLQLAADLGGLDGTMTDELCDQAPDQRLALVCGHAKVLDLVAVAHHRPLHA
jgi:hypothetical protein